MRHGVACARAYLRWAAWRHFHLGFRRRREARIQSPGEWERMWRNQSGRRKEGSERAGDGLVLVKELAAGSALPVQPHVRALNAFRRPL
jgi:hypothetical protein